MRTLKSAPCLHLRKGLHPTKGKAIKLPRAVLFTRLKQIHTNINCRFLQDARKPFQWALQTVVAKGHKNCL